MSLSQEWDDLKRRCKDLQVEHYPDVIQEYIANQDYDELIRFTEAFSYRRKYSRSYVNNTGTNIYVRDFTDLYAYMVINCTELDEIESAAYESAKKFIDTQLAEEEDSQGTLEDFEDPCELVLQLCISEKDELFDRYQSYYEVIYDDMLDDIRSIKQFVSNSLINEMQAFVTKDHELKGIAPYEIFKSLSPEEQLELANDKWRDVNLYRRSPLYPVFLVMYFPKESNISRDVALRHPYLMAKCMYIDELSMSIAHYTNSEEVLRETVRKYCEVFALDETQLVTEALNKMR